MTFRRYLSQDELQEVTEAAVAANLTDHASRDYLLAFIDQTYVLSLPVIPNPLTQLRSDLVRLNTVERLADGSVPLQIWLDSAATLAAGRLEEHEFRRYQERVAKKAVGLPPLPDPSALPEVVRNEAIVYKDDMLDFSFLAAGALAGASVAKLLVPRYVNGVPDLAAAGKPVAGTGWLITRDLLVTNHHVVNARSDEEPDAPEADLVLQAEGAIAKFDYDTADATGVDVAVRRLEAWDARANLDFAILRLELPPAGRAALRVFAHPVTHSPNSYMPLNVIQHPNGDAKHVACRNHLMTGTDATTMRYFTDTSSGSSRSPVFDDSWRVVALHRGARAVSNVMFQGRTTAWVNFGTQIASIFAYLETNKPNLLVEITHAMNPTNG